VLIGSGIRTRDVVADNAVFAPLPLDPNRQFIAPQCSGTLVLARLGRFERIAGFRSNWRRHSGSFGAPVVNLAMETGPVIGLAVLARSPVPAGLHSSATPPLPRPPWLVRAWLSRCGEQAW